MNDRTGQHVGNYRIIRPLGQGGFADVYLGEHLYLKRFAALKVLRRSLQEKDVERFLSEAQTLARLMHPHIVQVFEYAIEEGMPVLIMDYAPGGTVRDCYPRASRLPPRIVAIYIKQVAAALQYAHNQNVIHRDIKPENMLLRSPKELVLSDFGLALLTPSPEFLSTQAMAGTIPYIAPEQIQRKPVFASDQYSLAIVAYEWLCGRRPFEGDQYNILYQHISAAPPALREFAPDLPASIEEVVLKALAKDPQERFASVQSFAHALERACQHSNIADGHSTFDTLPEYPVSETEPQQKAYLVSTPSDAPFLARLQADLGERGVCIEHGASEQTLTNPLDEEEVRRQAMRTADIVLVLVSPWARSSHTIKEYLQIAHMYERRLLFVWVAGEEIAEVLPNSWGKAATIALIDAREDCYASAIDEIVAYIEEGPSITAHLQEEPVEILGEPRNPYKGLRAFTGDDATDFFGRETLIEELVETTKEMLTVKRPAAMPVRLLTLTGPSGSGKSSVVMAGLLPRLQSGALPGSEQWMYLVLVPGQHPVESLVLALAPQLPARSLKSLREDLEDDSLRGLHLLATQMMTQTDQKLVLLVDQFEEVFAQAVSEEERQRFIDLLVTAATEPRGSVLVLLTLRADFSDRPMHYPTFYRLMQIHSKVVLSMEMHDLRAIIERPAALPDVRLTFEDNLVGDLLFESLNQPGALPLLEFTLDQLFQMRDGHKLTLSAYKQIGGVKGALTKQAETTYTSLPSEEHRQLARALFLRLIDPGITEQDSRRRRAALSELSLPDPKQTTILREVADAFIAARLLTTNERAGTSTLEVSHEALIREWTRLADWLREAREDIHFQQTLSENVAEWERRGKPKDRLYRGSQLTEARTWARRNIPSSNEVAFLRASVASRVRLLVSVIAVLLIVVSSMGGASWVLTHQPPDPTRVSNLQDNGKPGSLRYAVDNAPPTSTITFDTSLHGTILLSSRDLNIAKDLTIRGPGAGILSISGGKSGHIVRVVQGAFVTISGLTFKDSQTPTGFINNEGTLILSNSTVSGNTGGGGISNYGTLTLRTSTVSGNTGGGKNNLGGGIYNGNALTLTNSTVSGNTVTGDSAPGGGIYNSSKGTLILRTSTVSGNTATGHNSRGGGIYNGNALTLTNSTVSGNTVTGSNSAGGGIFIQSSVQADGSSEIAQADLTFSTIYGNTALSGGDIAIEDMSFDSNGNSKAIKQVSQVKIRNSIVAGDPAHPGPDIVGMLTSYGYNLFQDNSGATFDPATRTQHGHDKPLSVNDLPKLFADPVGLRDNGGPTRTYALAPGSPALDVIPLDACLIDGKPSTDQRGVKRPQGKGCDIGAYESST